ncbi:unnamed protein product [Trichogramma brassicae]|uniref:Uncharacterized protein n=1 Tax=Trichogramma brassicae TaxID=86971 RepID=A0A6H5IHP7_9HYME|nr:unnamed protein product [Trichogramma brassicae]
MYHEETFTQYQSIARSCFYSIKTTNNSPLYATTANNSRACTNWVIMFVLYTPANFKGYPTFCCKSKNEALRLCDTSINEQTGFTKATSCAKHENSSLSTAIVGRLFAHMATCMV